MNPLCENYKRVVWKEYFIRFYCEQKHALVQLIEMCINCSAYSSVWWANQCIVYMYTGFKSFSSQVQVFWLFKLSFSNAWIADVDPVHSWSNCFSLHKLTQQELLCLTPSGQTLWTCTFTHSTPVKALYRTDYYSQSFLLTFCSYIPKWSGVNVTLGGTYKIWTAYHSLYALSDS